MSPLSCSFQHCQAHASTFQFNAVWHNALFDASTYDYSWSWLPGDQLNQALEFTTVADVEALDVLNSAFVIASK